MTEAQVLFLQMLSASLKNEKVGLAEIFAQKRDDEKSRLFFEIEALAREQAVTALINDYMLTWEPELIPQGMEKSLQKQTFLSAVMYYRMANFASYVLSLVKEQGFSACILKGVGLSYLYPKEELRKAGDVDLYMPVPEEFTAFLELLKKKGFQQQTSITDHHSSFIYDYEGVQFELELHKKPINSQEQPLFNEQVDEIFASFGGKKQAVFPQMPVINTNVPVLPSSENGCYLLLHMLQHFLSGGMGLRMLCDWVLFWKQEAKKEEFSLETYISYIKQCGLLGFHDMITGLCVSYLGLSKQDVLWMEEQMPKHSQMELFLKDIFDGGEFGGQDSARMVILSDKLTIRGLCLEYHRQMKLRFQRAGKVIMLWPFLWIATGVIFVYNNIFLRKTSVKKILKSSRERGKLLESLHLFETKT